MKIDTKEKYKARFAARGERRKRQWARSYMKSVTAPIMGTQNLGSLGVKYDGKERVHNIADCWPLIGRKDFVPVKGYHEGHGH